MTENVANPRRFQFRLRTLMIGITLLAIPCAYVGWQAKIVRERQQALKALTDSGTVIFTRETDFADADRIAGYHVDRDTWPSEVPWLRQCLGDEHISTIDLPPSARPADTEWIRSLFPEATVNFDRN
jgi:hypothetical protein